MNNTQPLLSICIPTYNRAKILDRALENIERELKSIDINEIELVIFNNCSKDDTQEIVYKYINKGLPIKYSKNEVNVGADGNFKNCFEAAKGQYLWLLSDDDHLKEKSLSYVLDLLRGTNYGLIHFKVDTKENKGTKVYNNSYSFLSDVNYLITFISANIVNTKFIKEINLSKYIGTSLIQLPVYLLTAKKQSKNIIVFNNNIFTPAVDVNTSGGYNFFNIFVTNYLAICKEYISDSTEARECYEKMKRKQYEIVVISFFFAFYRNRKYFSIKNCHMILLKNYGTNLYFYYLPFYRIIKGIYRKLFKA